MGAIVASSTKSRNTMEAKAGGLRLRFNPP